MYIVEAKRKVIETKSKSLIANWTNDLFSVQSPISHSLFRRLLHGDSSFLADSSRQ